MARRLDQLPAGVRWRTRYPDEWFDGGIWELDVVCDLDEPDRGVAARRIRAVAHHRGKRLTVRRGDPGLLVVQARPRPVG